MERCDERIFLNLLRNMSFSGRIFFAETVFYLVKMHVIRTKIRVILLDEKILIVV